MIHQNFQIVRLHVSVLRRAPEKIVRMLHDELIERRGRRHHHRARCSASPPRAPRALPCGRDRARISRHHARIERTDINSQFQRVRRHHAANSPLAQPAFDFAPLARQITAAISANRLGLLRAPAGSPAANKSAALRCAAGCLRTRWSAACAPAVPWPRASFRSNSCAGCPDSGSPSADCKKRKASPPRARRFPRPPRPASSISCAASSPGFAIVAEQQMNCGFDP